MKLRVRRADRLLPPWLLHPATVPRSEDDVYPFIREDVADYDSPQVFISASWSVLGPGLRSLPAGLLDGA